MQWILHVLVVDLVGRATSKTAVVETLVRSNALNLTGNSNFNSGGVKDGVGFVNVTEKFVDNFILRVLVPDYNAKDGRNIFVGSQNKSIRELLDAHGLRKCIVKAVAFTKVNGVPPSFMLEKMPFRTKENTVAAYYYQEYKIGCPDVEYSVVLDFIRNASYNNIGMFIKDIDVTTDYAGSFDKYELVDHLISMEGFREQGDEYCRDVSRTILNNDNSVGKNCLTFMENIDGFTTRQKIYNKMVQMLECKSVRSTVGSHWKNWVCQKDTRLAYARDRASERGLTRAEVTFYVESSIPTDAFIDSVLTSITRYVPKYLVYSTPYAAVWKTYCDTFIHSLVCIDRFVDIGIVVYSYNEITGNISGQVIERWSEREKWCLDKLTLNGNLPLDIIESNEVTKLFSGKKKDVILEICGYRYYKINVDNSTRFPTRLVSKGGVYSYNRDDNNASLLEKSGFVDHVNCIPYLSKSAGTVASKADAELRKVEVLHVQMAPCTTDKKKVDVGLKEKLIEEAKQIENIRKPLLTELTRKKNVIKHVKEFRKLFKDRSTVPLRDLSPGSYVVRVAKKLETRFGSSYKLLVEDGNTVYIVWSNRRIANILDGSDNLINLDGDFVYLDGKPLGVMEITGKGTNHYGKVTVYCTFVLNSIEKMEKILSTVSNCLVSKDITTLPRENLLPYRDYPNIITFPVGSLLQIEAIGYLSHYGTLRLVVQIEGNIYQAGKDLEEKNKQLTAYCSIKIEKIRVDRSRRVNYAICSIYESGDWTCMVDYLKIPMLRKFDGSTCVVDVRTLEVKGVKRKLLLTNNGDVFKLKKSKLEETVEPGFI